MVSLPLETAGASPARRSRRWRPRAHVLLEQLVLGTRLRDRGRALLRVTGDGQGPAGEDTRGNLSCSCGTSEALSEIYEGTLAYCRLSSGGSASSPRRVAGTGPEPEVEVPGLGHEVEAEASVPSSRPRAGSRLLVEAAGGAEVALRPERDLPVARLRAKRTHSSTSRAPSPSPRACGSRRSRRSWATVFDFSHEEDGAEDLAVPLRDPAPLAARVEALDELRHDLGDEGLELRCRIRTPARRAPPCR